MTAAKHPAPSAPLLSVAEGCATIRLNRPAHMNRLHREDLLVLRAHLDAVANDPAVRVLVLTGTGRAFCSGYHIGHLDAGDSAASEDPQLFERTVDALEALAMPTLARLNGGVYGGATDLALACDFRIGVDTMELRMPAARLGLHYYPNGLRRYVSRLGLGPAKRLFMLAESVDAAELLRIGYLDICVPPDRLDAQLRSLVATLAANAPLAVRGMKSSLNEIARGEFDLQATRSREASCASSEDLREGLAAFAQKRMPRFVGR
jgi:enoyl-CoA hydratase/carnithine racemase